MVLGLLITFTCMLAQSVPLGPVTEGVYLLAATPTPKMYAEFGADLYKFDSAGKLVFVLEIAKGDGVAPSSSGFGVDFVLADYDSRILVIGSPIVHPTKLDVVLMDAPGAIVRKQLQVPIYIPPPGYRCLRAPYQ